MGRPKGSKNKSKDNSVIETKQSSATPDTTVAQAIAMVTKPTKKKPVVLLPGVPVKLKPTSPVVVGNTPNASTNKHKGRPAGSKNKSKVLTAVNVTPEIIDTPAVIVDTEVVEESAESDEVEDDMAMSSEEIADKTNKTPIRTMKEYKERVAAMSEEEKAVSLPVLTEKPTPEERQIESELTEDSHAALHKYIHSPEMKKFVELVECVAENSNMSLEKRKRLQNSTELEKPKFKTIYHKACSILAVYFGLDFKRMIPWLDKRYPTITDEVDA